MGASESPAVRVGLVGFGLAGSVFHAPLIASTPGLRLEAIVTGNAERAARAGSLYPDARVVGAADALWAPSPLVDVAVIASPNRTHAPLALAALEGGLHVVVDKPLARTVAEAERVAETARRVGRMLTVFQNRRWDGDFLTLRRLLDEGALGDVLRYESRFDRWRPTPKPGWRQEGAPETAGGLL